jgi:hypothetical protein
MESASKIFTMDESFDLEMTRTGETRIKHMNPNYSPDYDGPEDNESYVEERFILTHPDGRQGETWVMVETK